MKAIIHLPHASRSAPHIGKVFIRSAEHQKHVWKNRVFDLTVEKERNEFNAQVALLCVKDSIYGQTPVAFILPPAAPASSEPSEETETAPEETAPEENAPAPTSDAPAKKAAKKPAKKAAAPAANPA